MRTVVVLGASAKADRYSHQAVLRFAARGYRVIPVHPSGEAVAGHATTRSLTEVVGPVDIVSVYVNPTIGLTAVADIARLAPRLVVLNPGADGPEMLQAMAAAGLTVQEACTLVLLGLGDPLDLCATR